MTRYMFTKLEVTKGIAYHNKLSSLYWVTAEGVSRRNSHDQQGLVYKLHNFHPNSGLALETTTRNLYTGAVLSDSIDGSIVKVVSHSLNVETDIITTETKITALAIDGFLSEIAGPHTAGRIIRSTMDGNRLIGCNPLTRSSFQSLLQRTLLSYEPSGQTWCCNACKRFWVVITTVTNRRLWRMAQLKGQPLSLSYFFENHISSGVWQTNFIYNQLKAIERKSTYFCSVDRGSAERLLTTHFVMEL